MKNYDGYIYFSSAKSIKVYICTKCRMVVENPSWLGKRKLKPYCEPCFYSMAHGPMQKREEPPRDIPLYKEKIDIRDILIDFLNAIQTQCLFSEKSAQDLYDRIKKLKIKYE